MFNFLLASSVLFAFCLLLTATRQMADNLAVRLYPWGWPALAVLLTLYFGGFTDQLPLRNYLYLHGAWRALFPTFIGLGISIVMTYLTLFSQPHTPSTWQSLWNSCAEKNWKRALQKLPPWATSLVLSWFFVLALAILNSSTMLGFSQKLVFSPLFFAVSLACLLVRDACLLLFFSFKPKARRVFPAFLTCLFLLYGLLPWLAELLSLSGLEQAIRPLGGAMGASIALIHALAAGGLLAWRWQKIRIR